MPTAGRQLVKPPALRPGDTIGIVAPASNVKEADLEAGCAALRAAGYKTFYLDSILDRDLYFAGRPGRRLRELEEMFEREEVRAILCARGGYGANYVLQDLDWKKIASHPKIFIGYSDVSCLLTQLVDSGLVTFHGPMAAKDWVHADGVNLESWIAALTQTAPWDIPVNDSVTTLAGGETEGACTGAACRYLLPHSEPLTKSKRMTPSCLWKI